MPKIQLAIQGGGAKIASLLAVGAAIQSFPITDLEITRLAGTSAGAIVACMLGAGIDIDDFSMRLKQSLGKELIAGFEMPGMIGIGRVLSTGKPIWSQKNLEKLLTQEFARKKVTFLKDIAKNFNRPVLVMATDLSEAKAVPVSEDERIGKALMDSCGIPFLFRTWKHELVDGGIAENFAGSFLSKDKAIYGPVLGVVFKNQDTSGAAPSSLKSFAAALLDTAMRSATAKSHDSLGSPFLFEIDTELDTFSFEQALGDGLGEHYRRLKSDAIDWFSDYIADPDAALGDIWSRENVSTMTKLAQMYRTQHAGQFIKYEQCVMEVFAHSLKDEDAPDVVQYKTTFRTMADPLYCHKVALTESEGKSAFRRSSWHLFEQQTGHLIGVSFVPILDSQTSADREVLAYFEVVLPKNSGPYTLVIKDSVKGLLKSFKKKKSEEFRMQPSRTNQSIDEISIALHVPDTTQYQNLKFVPLPGASPGGPMPPVELRTFELQAPPGFRTVGWKGVNVPAGYTFGPDATF
ncbi:MAG TPA: patatin-like phospholipase family protein [Acidobacteriaceae bacterium]|nr:patatin-like phospholipase family protein [Acidobacteriaceae bacterium]